MFDAEHATYLATVSEEASGVGRRWGDGGHMIVGCLNTIFVAVYVTREHWQSIGQGLYSTVGAIIRTYTKAIFTILIMHDKQTVCVCVSV